MKHQFEFYTQFNQFYLTSDNGAFLNSNNSWSNSDYLNGISVFDNSIICFTRSYGNIKGEIELLEKQSEISNYDLYDYIVEGGIDIKSGTLQILDCPNSSIELDIKLKPGKYRIRVYGSNLESVKEPDLANENDNDYYKIEMWESSDMECKVLKRYNLNQ